MTYKKLQHYFECHNIEVVARFPLKKVLSKPKDVGRLAYYAVRLGSSDINHKLRTTIKPYMFFDFII